jgi:hypothetical protein
MDCLIVACVRIKVTNFNAFDDVGRDSSVGIATRYGLDGTRIESLWRRNFPHPSGTAYPASCTMGAGSFPGVKRPGRGVDHPPPRFKKG